MSIAEIVASKTFMSSSKLYINNKPVHPYMLRPVLQDKLTSDIRYQTHCKTCQNVFRLDESFDVAKDILHKSLVDVCHGISRFNNNKVNHADFHHQFHNNDGAMLAV